MQPVKLLDEHVGKGDRMDVRVEYSDSRPYLIAH